MLRKRKEKTSRRLTFGGEYKTPAAAKAAFNIITEQLHDIEATVERDLTNSKASSGLANGNRESDKLLWTDIDSSSQGSKGERGDRPSDDSPDLSSASDSDDFADLSTPVDM